jgi:hypothetical protein
MEKMETGFLSLDLYEDKQNSFFYYLIPLLLMLE